METIKIPKSILTDSSLSLTERDFLTQLFAEFEPDKDLRLEVHATPEDLARMSGRKKRMIFYLLADLKAKRWMRWVQERGCWVVSPPQAQARKPTRFVHCRMGG